jgi:hypothetical protein
VLQLANPLRPLLLVLPQLHHLQRLLEFMLLVRLFSYKHPTPAYYGLLLLDLAHSCRIHLRLR